MSEEDDTRKQFAEEPPEDLEVKDEEAAKVGGGDKINHGDISITKHTDTASPGSLG